MVRTSHLGSRGREFDSRPVHCRVVQVNSASHPSGIGKSITGLLAGAVTCYLLSFRVANHWTGVKAERVHLCRVAGNTA